MSEKTDMTDQQALREIAKEVEYGAGSWVANAATLLQIANRIQSPKQIVAEFERRTPDNIRDDEPFFSLNDVRDLITRNK